MKSPMLAKSEMIFLSILMILSLLHVNAYADETKDATPKLWKTRIELSFVTTSGNTENSTFASKVAVEGKPGPYRMFFGANMIVQGSNGVETANRTKFDGQFERTVNDRFFVLAELKAERDTFSGYDYRLSAGPGLGYDIIKNTSVDMKTFASVVYFSDNFSRGEEELDNYLTIKVSMDSVFRFNDNLETKNGFDFFRSTKESDNYLIINETVLTARINKSLGIGLSYLVNFDNSPPLASLKKLNSTFLSSLVITF